MDIIKCIQKIYPDWRGVVWSNSHEGIKPHELETRPIPTLKELEAVWPGVQAGAEKAKAIADTKALLIEVDLKSIRSLREWLAKQPDCPKFIAEHEKQACALRETMK